MWGGGSKKRRYEQNGNINKDIENLKRNQREILEVKSTIIEVKPHQRDSKADVCRQTKNISKPEEGQWKLLSLRNKKKKD